MGLSFCSLLEPATGLRRVKKLAAPMILEAATRSFADAPFNQL